MADGFFFANDPDLSKIKAQKALAQALMQKGLGDPGSAPYGGLSNAVNEVVGAYLNSRSDKANAADYAKQLGSLLGKDTLPADTPVTVTPAVQADAQGNPVRPANPDTMSWQGGSLGMDRNKSRLLASVLSGVDPDQGRTALQGVAMDQLTPKPLQHFSPNDDLYRGDELVRHGTPEQKLQTAGGTYTLDGGKTWNKIPGYVEQAGAVADARAAGTAAHRAPPRGGAAKPDKNNPLGILPPWLVHGGH